MTFLEIVQALRVEVDAAGATLSSVEPANISTEDSRLKGWANRAWRDIQLMHGGQWKFMRRPFGPIVLVAGQWDYNPTAAPFSISNLRELNLESLRLYQTGDYGTEYEPNFIDYEVFKRQYRFGSMRTTTGNPVVFSVDPARHIVFGPVPIAGYSCEGEYWATPADMTLDADVPAMPAEYHMLIVYRAMLSDAEYDWNAEQKGRAVREHRRMMAEMELTELPTSGMYFTLA